MTRSPQPDPAQESKRACTLANMRRLARCDSNGQPKPILSWYDMLMARHLAPPVAWAALRMGLSADFVTWLSVLSVLGGAAALACGGEMSALAAVFLLQFSYLLDCADGDVARARGTSSMDGYLRDTFRHYLAGPAIVGGLALNVYARHPEMWVVLCGLSGVVFATRMAGDMSDRVVLDALRQRARQKAPLLSHRTSPPLASSGWLAWCQVRLVTDLALMNWVSLAILADALYFRPAGRAWQACDWLLPALAGWLAILKTASLIRLWRKGITGQVAQVEAELEEAWRERTR